MATINHFSNIKDFTPESVKASYWKPATLPAAVVDSIDLLNGYQVNPDHLFSFGNSKLYKNIAIFSLYEIVTCPGCERDSATSCAKTCYAKKASGLRPAVYNKRIALTECAINRLSILENAIDIALTRIEEKNARKVIKLQKMQREYSAMIDKRTKAARSKKNAIVELKNSIVEFVRIHEAGDFFNQAYIETWARVARKHNSFVFYFYTKSASIFDFSNLVNLDNVNMVDSVIPCDIKNYGSFDWLRKTTKRLYENGYKNQYRVCGYGFKDKNGKKRAPHCGIDCTACMSYKWVLFLQH